MVTWKDVLDWRLDPLAEAARALSDSRRVLVDAADDAAAALSGFRSAGETADAARQALSQLLDDLDRQVADVSELMMSTSDASDGVSEVRTLVQDCLDQAAIDSLTIRSDGSVTWPPPAPPPPGRRPALTTHNQVNAQSLSAQITKVLDLANQVDQDYAKRLRAVEDGSHRSQEDHSSPSQGLPDLPQEGWSTAEVATWWNALTRQERDAIIRDHPEAIGNLDGIDMGSRDLANRALLPGMLDRARRDMDEAKRALDQALKSTDETLIQQASMEWARARERVSDLEAVEKTIDAGSDRHLVVLDPSGNLVKAAVAVGDVDRADHVATFVPGMTTTVRGSLDDYVRHMERLRGKAADAAGLAPSGVASIAWLGYEAPQDIDVSSTAKAHAGAERLSSFVEGIQSSRTSSGAGDPHQTVLGHSYGSTTAGMAVNQVREDTVDDLVMFGSPGSGAQDVREYSLDPGHAYVSAVPEGDAVQGMGPDWAFGKNPAKMEGVTHLSSDATGSANYDSSISWWQFWDGFKNHSTYLDENTRTLENFAQVVGGVR
ncbi:MAG: alpha/beta hydrolase family protein [Actinomyces sp.]|nr:alpha/beta hydrolase family protein [Actinomyces sp.]